MSLCCAAMARQTHLDHLASVSLFSACSKKELQAVAKATDEVTIPAGKTLCEQGAVGREAFVIVEGTAEVRRNKKKVAEIGPGTCVGELALLDHRPRTASVIATTDLTVLVIGVARVRRPHRRGPADHAQADEVDGLEDPRAGHPGLRLTVRALRPRTTTFAA